MFDPINYSLTRQSTGIISRLAKIVQDNADGTFQVITIDDLPQETYTAQSLSDHDFSVDDEILITLLSKNSTSVAYIDSNKKNTTMPSGQIKIGSPTTGNYDGLIPLTSSDFMSDVFQVINKTMSVLHPMAPYLGQANNGIGNGDMIYVASANITTSYISASNGAYNTAGYENTQRTIYKKGSTHQFKTSSWIRGIEVGTIFRLKYNGSVIDTLTITDPSVNESTTNIFFSNARQNVSSEWEKHLHFQLNLDSTLPTGGWFALQFEQETLSGTLYSDSIEGFFDDHRNIIVNTFATSLNAGYTTIPLSGISFVNTGSFNVGFNLGNLFYESHIAGPITLNLNGIGAQNKSYVRGDFSPIIYNDTAIKTYTAAISGIQLQTSNISASLTASNAFNTITNSANSNILLNTIGNTATESDERFTDEYYRLSPGSWNSLPASLTGNWNSSTSLLSNNGLQIMNGLQYPKINFSIYSPLGNPDYTGCAGDRVYYRVLRLAGTPKTNGTLTINGMDYASLGTTWELYIKIPGQTGWLKTWLPFDSATFQGTEGQGIHISHTSTSITYSTGSFSTGNANYSIVVRIMMKQTCNVKLTRLIYS